ncbi:hypothetical protein R70723_25055 [Paenibacillus sp. FSL R7-0273]|uniref:YfhD family protein n=1 Tax=Paenibacillus sp. FSL R7-0273 TaxID=1536772 RepID=UPI0004F9131A|nr:YfhD family protein [Paenibacillus sp. FSL R7-0273]AIQ48810.1 hypothetical protein R70723_25055 [Paenibacillus sp. FSL R7-0273]OMF93854.1 YfhD family protein [Paenibacillus sp. FSL R7-0273]
MDRENSDIISKTGKQKLLYEAKLEDVQFTAAEADHDDLEALARSQEADKRQLNELIKKK